MLTTVKESRIKIPNEVHDNLTLPSAFNLERVLNVQQSAGLFGISVATFRRLHFRGQLPRAIKLSERRIGWRAGDLISHLKNSNTIQE